MKTTIINSTTSLSPLILGIILSLVGITVSLHGQTWQSYNGSFSGDWEDPNHWTSVPVSGSSVLFNFHSATPETITLNANTPNLNGVTLQHGSLAPTIPERDLTIDLNGYNLSANSIAAPSGAFREVGRLTFVSTGSPGSVYNLNNAFGVQLQMFNAAGAANRPTTSYVTFSTNTQATLWFTTIAQPTAENTVAAYLRAEANAQLSFSNYINVAQSGGTAANPVTGTVTISDNATFTQASGQTMTLGSVDGYSTGNLTISGGSTDVTIGAINWRNGTFTVELDSPDSFNPVNVRGNLTIADGVLLDVNLLAGGSMPSEPLAIMTWGGTRTGEFTLSSTAVAAYWQLEYDDLTKTLFLSIPEPSSVVLLVIGLTGLLRRRVRP